MNGRKRHVLVETQGLVVQAKVHPADLHDQEGANLLLLPLVGKLPRMAKLWGDNAYRGLQDWVRETLGWALEVVRHPWTGAVWLPPGVDPPECPAGFHVLPRRWVVERTFAWVGRNRRLAKDYEAVPDTEEAWTYLAMVRLMLRRLATPEAA